MTLNSDRKLRDCLNSIYQNMPVHELIVVDGGSTDQTLRILDEFHACYGNVKIIHDRGTRATARQKGIENVTTEWFVFVDSDVLLCRDWYKKASQFVAPDVGAVWGTEVWSTIKNRTVMKYFLLVTRKIFEIRGGTHDTLIRAHAVRGIHIPWNLHVFEDAFIKDYIEDHGYRVVACYDPFCMHFRPKSVWTFKGSLSVLVESLRFGRPRLLLQLVLAYGFYTVYSVCQMFAGE